MSKKNGNGKTKIAYLFPGQGQGTIKVGMGKEAFQYSRRARRVFRVADSCLRRERPFSELCFEGPEEELFKTQNSQLASLIVSLAHLAIRSNVNKEDGDLVFEPKGKNRPNYLVGHSVGYIAALVCAGSINFLQAIDIVRVRSVLMSMACRERPGRMSVLFHPNIRAIEKLCLLSLAQIGNYNDRTQIVLSGPNATMEQLEAVIRANRLASRIIPLETEGAFHSKCMDPVVAPFAEYVSRLRFLDLEIPIIGNTKAQIVKTAAEAKQELVEQISLPVRWFQSMAVLNRLGVNATVEMCGDVLSRNLARSGSKRVKILSYTKELAKRLASRKNKGETASL